MGTYLNPENGPFEESVEREIYVDKSLLIEKVLVSVSYEKQTKEHECVIVRYQDVVK